jgi:hypothetical protein
MPVSELLYQQSEIAVVTELFILLLVATELGFRRGRVIRGRLEDPAKAELTTLQGAMVGLLALLLAFSFAMAESRFETRRQLVLEEANAIGTTYLRSQALGEPYHTKVVTLIREYVSNRLEYYAAGIDPQKLDEVNKETNLVADRPLVASDGRRQQGSSLHPGRTVNELAQRSHRSPHEA